MQEGTGHLVTDIERIQAGQGKLKELIETQEMFQRKVVVWV